MTDVEQIAKSLTKAQREMVMTDDKWFNRQWIGYWCGHPSSGSKLHKMGLVEKASQLTKPTELGLALRAHLSESQS